MAGRGFGKTRTGAEWLIEKIRTKKCVSPAIIGATNDDVKKIMVEGKAGILRCCAPSFRPEWKSSKKQLIFKNGIIAYTYSAEKPDRLRGPEHDIAWCDELAAWQRLNDTWDNLLFCMRDGEAPERLITTTPKPKKVLLNLVKQAEKNRKTIVTRGDMYENAANLSQGFMEDIAEEYEGTKLGRQEIYADLMEQIEGALWNRGDIDRLRVSEVPQMERIVVAIDPAGHAHKKSNKTGIICAGRDANRHSYVLEDRTGRYPPSVWAKRAIGMAHRWGADCIVAEDNYGGDMVKETIEREDPDIRVKIVTASRGKYIRAEPIAAFTEKGRWHHVGHFNELEDQMCSMTVDGIENDGDGKSTSPDNLDAMVWAGTDLMISEKVSVLMI